MQSKVSGSAQIFFLNNFLFQSVRRKIFIPALKFEIKKEELCLNSQEFLWDICLFCVSVCRFRRQTFTGSRYCRQRSLGSLRQAVLDANAAAGDDVIEFSSLFNTPQTITLTSGEIVVAANGSLTINGPGADKLTISGNSQSRILSSGANVVVNINSLRFTAGNGVGAVNTGRGGAIYNVGGTMVITNSIITGNTATIGGALNNAASSSPSVPANLTIINCSITGNSSTVRVRRCKIFQLRR